MTIQMTTQEKLATWSNLVRQADALKSEILSELGEGEEIKIPGAKAYTSPGRGTYAYEEMAMRLEPEQEVIYRYTKTVVDWKAVCDEVGYDDELKKKFYTPGKLTKKVELL